MGAVRGGGPAAVQDAGSAGGEAAPSGPVEGLHAQRMVQRRQRARGRGALADGPIEAGWFTGPVGGLRRLVVVDALDEIPDQDDRERLLTVLAARMSDPDGSARFLGTTRPLPQGETARLHGPASASTNSGPSTSRPWRRSPAPGSTPPEPRPEPSPHRTSPTRCARRAATRWRRSRCSPRSPPTSTGPAPAHGRSRAPLPHPRPRPGLLGTVLRGRGPDRSGGYGSGRRHAPAARSGDLRAGADRGPGPRPPLIRSANPYLFG